MPHQLLQTDPTDPASPQKATLTAADWTLILGNDPLNYDYSGIDPHMIESYQSRVGVAVPPGAFPCRIRARRRERTRSAGASG